MHMKMARNAVLGAVVWLALGALAFGGGLGPWMIEPLFLLAPLILVPLALGLIDDLHNPWSRRLQLVCALAAAASFVVPKGKLASGLAVAWCCFTVVLALHGLHRFRVRELASPAEFAIDAALVYLPVGGGWLVLSRLGAAPLGFQEPIVLLTAVHFHFAAFTTLVLTGLVGRVLAPSLLYSGLVAGVVVGTPMLAAGITWSPSLELLGASILVFSLGSLGLLILARVRPRVRGRIARGLLTISGSSPLFAMPLALGYAWGQFTGRPLVDLSFMTRAHGLVNALGFGLCGLLGWTLAVRAGFEPCSGKNVEEA